MVCTRRFDDRDDAAFELAVARHGSFENARYVYASQLQMDSDDWDEGWGWENSSTNRAVAKMIASCYLLERGVGAAQGREVVEDGLRGIAAGASVREQGDAVGAGRSLDAGGRLDEGLHDRELAEHRGGEDRRPRAVSEERPRDVDVPHV